MSAPPKSVLQGGAISPTLALLCALTYPILYVAPFYLSPTLRTTSLASRDAPGVIKARVRAVGFVCLGCSLVTITILASLGQASSLTILHVLGLYPVHLSDVLRVLLLNSILFVAPLYETLIVDRSYRDLSLASLRSSLWDSWTGYRNLVIAPLSEELVFRSLVIPLFLLASVSATRIVFTTPLIFGLAHVHHLFELLRSRTPAGRSYPPTRMLAISLLQVTFMFAYTSMFGFFAAFVFQRTGSLWAAVAAHSFCNWQGFPRVTGKVGQFASSEVSFSRATVTPDVAQGRRVHSGLGAVGMTAEDGGTLHTPSKPNLGPQNLGIAWTVVYYVLLPVGAYGFYKYLWPLTESANALAEF